MYCQKCGTENAPSNKYCRNCGYLLKTNEVSGEQTRSSAAKGGGSPATFIKRGWKIIVPLVIVLLLVLNANAIIAQFVPSYAVKAAVDKTSSELESRIGDSPFKAFELLYESLLDGSITAEIYYDDGWSRYAGNASILSKYKDKSFGIIMNIEDYFDLEAYMNDKRIAFTSSYFDNKFYGLTYDSIAEDIDTLGEKTYIDPYLKETLITGIDTLKNLFGTGNTSEYGKYEDLFADFIKKLEPVSEKTTIRIDGEDVNCKSVKYVITGKEMSGLLDDIYELISTDDSILAPLVPRYAYDTGLYDRRQFLDEIKAELGQLKQLFAGDFEVFFHISKNRLVKISVSGDIGGDVDGAELELSVGFGLDAKKDDLTFEFKLRDSRDYVTSFELTYETRADGSEQSDTVKIELMDGYYSESAKIETDWDKKSGDFVIKFIDAYHTHSLDGNLKIYKDSLEFEVHGIENLKLTVAAHKGVKIPKISFVNIDKWDEKVIEVFEDIG